MDLLFGVDGVVFRVVFRVLPVDRRVESDTTNIGEVDRDREIDDFEVNEDAEVDRVCARVRERQLSFVLFFKNAILYVYFFFFVFVNY